MSLPRLTPPRKRSGCELRAAICEGIRFARSSQLAAAPA